MAIQILSILGILILAYGFISEYRKRVHLQKKMNDIGKI